MRYEHIIRYVAAMPWAILPEKMAELLAVLAFRAAGHEYSAEEIRARLGDPPQTSQPQPKAGAGVAVIPIRGVIAHRMGGMDESSGGTSTERIAAMIRQVAGDASVGTIVYDVDSAGGTIAGVQELAAEMFALRGVKRQIAHANSLMASAAYWLASQADEIVAIPSARVGSIGVFSAHHDLSAALEKEGIKVTLVSAGKFKTEGNPFEPLSDEARSRMQARVDDAYARFVSDVARGRRTERRQLSAVDVRTGFGEGRALDAEEAKAVGLVDRIGTFEETLSRATRAYTLRKGPRADADDEPDVQVQEETPVPVIDEAAKARRRREIEIAQLS